MATPKTWACWLGGVAILATLPACTPDSGLPEPAPEPEKRGLSRVDASQGAPEMGVDGVLGGEDSGAVNEQRTDVTMAGADGTDVFTPDHSQIDAVRVDIEETWDADIISSKADEGDANEPGVIVDAQGLIDSLADTTADIGGGDSSDTIGDPAGLADAKPWSDSKAWPLYAVDIAEDGLCYGPMPDNVAGYAERFCRADWKECTTTSSNLRGPCGWIHCCNQSFASWYSPGCPKSLKTYTGLFPSMFCPPMVDLNLYETKIVPFIAPKCCPKFIFKWP